MIFKGGIKLLKQHPLPHGQGDLLTKYQAETEKGTGSDTAS